MRHTIFDDEKTNVEKCVLHSSEKKKTNTHTHTAHISIQHFGHFYEFISLLFNHRLFSILFLLEILFLVAHLNSNTKITFFYSFVCVCVCCPLLTPPCKFRRLFQFFNNRGQFRCEFPNDRPIKYCFSPMTGIVCRIHILKSWLCIVRFSVVLWIIKLISLSLTHSLCVAITLSIYSHWIRHWINWFGDIKIAIN